MIYLTKIEPERNMARFYALDLQPNLFGEWSAIKEWGRIGRAGQGRSALYAERVQAETAFSRELGRRIRRGYRASAGSGQSLR
jgi:predicted DNA-binding WGR domain protein